jgi:hypothetical protein
VEGKFRIPAFAPVTKSPPVPFTVPEADIFNCPAVPAANKPLVKLNVVAVVPVVERVTKLLEVVPVLAIDNAPVIDDGSPLPVT